MAALLPCQGGRAQAGCRAGVDIQGLFPTHSKTPGTLALPTWAMGTVSLAQSRGGG